MTSCSICDFTMITSSCHHQPCEPSYLLTLGMLLHELFAISSMTLKKIFLTDFKSVSKALNAKIAHE